MRILIPGNKPNRHPSDVRSLLNRALDSDAAISAGLIRSHCPTMILAIRGYFRDTMGIPGINDVGIFDDAAFIVSGNSVIPFNWNTDPSRVGWNPEIDKNFAMLAPGIWPFRRGQHKNKGEAWRQLTEDEAKPRSLSSYFHDSRADGEFTVYRAASLEQVLKKKAKTETGYYAINIHWGGEYGTSSWGCQTAPPVQWREFQKTTYKLAGEQKFLPYVLIDNPDT